jgi:hypothetical protein
MGQTRTRQPRARRAAGPASAAGQVVYVLDAWNDTDQESVVQVFATRQAATRAMARLLEKPGDWYAGIVKRTVH